MVLDAEDLAGSLAADVLDLPDRDSQANTRASCQRISLDTPPARSCSRSVTRMSNKHERRLAHGSRHADRRCDIGCVLDTELSRVPQNPLKFGDRCISTDVPF